MARNKKHYLPKPRKVRVPNQEGHLPYEITFDHYIVGLSGRRDQFVERKTVKFDHASDLADYYEQNCLQAKLKDFRKSEKEGESEHVSVG
jgi:hypothetical protein